MRMNKQQLTATVNDDGREVLDVIQAAAYLGVSTDTLYGYAARGFVPAFKLGNRWRFKRSRLDAWVNAQIDQACIHTPSE